MRFSYIILALCMVSMASAVDSVDVYVFGLSHHMDQSVIWNERNPGLAIGLSHQTEQHPDTDITLDVGTYKDSMAQQAKFALIGLRAYVIGERQSFHSTIQIGTGYYDGSGFRGIGFSANASVGYDRVDICMTGKPSTGSPDPNQCGWYAIFLRIRVLDF
jgi:hypothetical protein